MCIENFEKLPHCYYKGVEYIVWQDDETSRVAFTEIPRIGNKLANITIMTEKQIKAAKKKPLFLENEVGVLLVDKIKGNTYTFKIKIYYDYDGASIHRAFWRVIGSKENIEFKIAALIHDVLCENHNFVNGDRYFADKVFERLLYVSDVGAFRRWLMFHSVDNFQKFCGWQKGGAA